MSIMKTQKDKMIANENDDLQGHYDFDYTKAESNRFAERIHQKSVLMAALQNMPLIIANQEQIPALV